MREMEAKQENIVESHDTLVADKQRLQEANSDLRAEVASLTERLAAVTAAGDTSPAVSEAATGGVDFLGAKTAIPFKGFCRASGEPHREAFAFSRQYHRCGHQLQGQGGFLLVGKEAFPP